MARRRYYRVRRVYPKQKWLVVNNEITVVTGNSGIIDGSSYQTNATIITENATRTDASGGGGISAASIIKCGRFRFKGVLVNPTNGGISSLIGLAYLPEGYSLDLGTNGNLNSLGNTFFYKHPEWILAWTRLDFTNAGQSNEIRLSSRLKRNLNSGDRIVVFKIDINNVNTQASIYPLVGTVSYVCRTN